MIKTTLLLPVLIATALLTACSQNNSSPSGEASPAPEKAAAESSEAAVAVDNAFMFAPAPGQKNGAIYLRLTNNSEREVMVLDVATAIAGMAMVHRTVYEEGMMRMKHVHHLSIAPGQSLTFEPNGYHIMVMDLADVPAPGEQFAASVTLSGGQTLDFDVLVKTQ